MKFLGIFDPTVTTGINGIAKGLYIGLGVADPGQKVLFTNLAPVNILLNFEDGSSDILHAGQANYWTLDNITPTIEWSQQKILNIAGAPINQCSVVLYNADEKVQGVYPTSLIYFNVVGNPGGVSTNVSGTGTDLINDGQAVGHTFIESTPIGQATSAVSLTNDGQFLLRALIGGTTYAQQIKTQLTGNSPLIGNNGTITEVQGGMQVDQSLGVVSGLTVTGSTSLVGATMSGSLSVTGTTLLSGAVTANGGLASTSLSASTTLSVTGSSTLVGTVNCNALNGSNLSATGTITATSSITGSFLRASGGTFYGNDPASTIISTSGTGVTGVTRIQSSNSLALQVPVNTTVLSVLAGSVNVTGTFTSSGDITATTNLIVGATTTLIGALSVGGVTTLSNTLDMNSNPITDCNTIKDSNGNTYISITPSSNTRIQSGTTISLQVPAGTTVASVDSAGLHVSGSGNKLFLPTGSIGAVSSGSATLNSTGVSVTHSLGATPDIVLLICTNGPSTSTNSVASVGATTFTGYSTSTLTYKWIAIKF